MNMIKNIEQKPFEVMISEISEQTYKYISENMIRIDVPTLISILEVSKGITLSKFYKLMSTEKPD